MINLLLPEEQDLLRAEYRHRLSVVVGSLTGVWFLIILVIAISLFGYMLIEKQEVATALAEVEKSALGSKIEVQAATVTKLNALTKQWHGGEMAVLPSDLVQRLLDRRGRVTIQTINSSAKTPGTINLAGKSSTRPDFLAYLEALRLDPQFAEVVSPVKNLIQEKNLPFTLTIILKSAPAKK